MVHEKLTKKKIMEVCQWLEFYDDNGHFPWERQRIDITLPAEVLKKLEHRVRREKKNRSQIIEESLSA